MSNGKNREMWSGRLVVIIAMISMAVGTGNIWRFPRIAAAQGGGAFIFALTIALVLWAIPLLMAEFYMGYRSRLGNLGAFRDFMGKKYTWVGAWMALVCIGITFYYAVVCGWTIRYFVVAVTGQLGDVPGQVMWDAFKGNAGEQVFYHFIAVLIVFLVVYRGIKGGLESVLKVMLPSLLVVLVILAARAVTLPGAAEGLRFLFVPDWSLLGTGEIWLQAFTQAAWSTGAGWGLLLVYAVYTREREDIAVNSFIIGFADVFVGFIAGIAVLGTVFALAASPEIAREVMAGDNFGITFVGVVDLLAKMPGSAIIAPLFFLALSLAGVSSLIAMLELITTNLANLGIDRKKAAIYGGIACFVLGVPSAVSFDFLENQDWVWGVGLLISGLLTAMAMMKYGVEKARSEINESSDMNVGAWWSWLIRLIPVMFVFLFGWWVWQSIGWYPDTWWHPFELFNVGTMVFQWLILFIIVYALNGYFNKNLESGPMTKLDD